MTSLALLPDPGCERDAEALAARLRSLGFRAAVKAIPGETDIRLPVMHSLRPDRPGVRGVTASGNRWDMLDEALPFIPVDFESLPLVVEGESKIVRRWTDDAVLVRLKPTVYSFTENRYGVVPGTDAARARCSSAIFRQLRHDFADDADPPLTAFLGVVESDEGPLLAQRLVAASNLEVRVKRYHVGSPVHRYRYTDRYHSTQACGPIGKWSRFDTPVVCFDWRHPLADEDGDRLADEPISDDYAGVWMEDVDYAKRLARRVFSWLERSFAARGLLLIDICLQIDWSGHVLYGEISPDCMRVRRDDGHATAAASLDKDVWRDGGGAEQLLARYEEVAMRLQMPTRKESPAWA